MSKQFYENLKKIKEHRWSQRIASACRAYDTLYNCWLSDQVDFEQLDQAGLNLALSGVYDYDPEDDSNNNSRNPLCIYYNTQKAISRFKSLKHRGGGGCVFI